MKLKPLVTIAGLIMAAAMSVTQADVTLFGHIDTSIDAIDQDGGSDDINFNCTTCSIGFKGKEDLGNGLAAIFKLDWQYDTINRNGADYSGSFTDRDQWLGRVKRIISFVLITVVWRLAYTGLGYGATGTLLYIDPILNPVDFITQLVTRFPVLLVSAVGLP